MCIRDRLYTGEGKEDIVDKSTPEAPLALIIGAGFLLEAFEKQLMGLEAGDKFDFTLKDVYKRQALCTAPPLWPTLWLAP